MKSSTFGIMVLMIVLLALSLSVPFAEDDCPDLRACVENCSEIQNCTMFMSCIENCTINVKAATFGEAKSIAIATGRMQPRAMIPESDAMLETSQTFDPERAERYESNGEGYESPQSDVPETAEYDCILAAR
ncbi:MAG: hypothetical protein LUQ47_05040 [Methanotrichaceae archaeon]|nr:hypothetical protein [Methanotrichaceae archaeon]